MRIVGVDQVDALDESESLNFDCFAVITPSLFVRCCCYDMLKELCRLGDLLMRSNATA